MKQLREYQEIGLNKALSLDCKRYIVQLATGGGKTVIMSHHVKALIEKYKPLGKRVVVIADRAKLISQIRETFLENGIWIQQFGTSTKRAQNTVWCYICTSQLAFSRLKKNKDFFNEVGAVICDEAHITTHNSSIDILHENFGCDVIGYTATPIYSGKKNISDYYQKMVAVADVPELLDMGFLVKPKTYSVLVKEADMATLKMDTAKGDYTEKSLLSLFSMKERLELLWESYKKLAKGRTIIFCASCAHCTVTANFLRKKGLDVREVTSKQNDDEIKSAYGWIKTNNHGVLVSVDMLTKGYDEPLLETVIMFRSTQSLSLLMQCFGRGGRLCKEINKTEWVCIDLGNNIMNSDGSMNHGKWEHGRDWEALFYRKHKPVYPHQKICPICFECVPKDTQICGCGFVFEIQDNEKEEKAESKNKNKHDSCIKFDIVEILDKEISRKDVASSIVDKYNSSNYKPHWAAFKLLGEICKTAKKKYGELEPSDDIVNACLSSFEKNIPNLTGKIENMNIFSPKGKFWRSKAVEFLTK